MCRAEDLPLTGRSSIFEAGRSRGWCMVDVNAAIAKRQFGSAMADADNAVCLVDKRRGRLVRLVEEGRSKEISQSGVKEISVCINPEPALKTTNSKPSSDDPTGGHRLKTFCKNGGEMKRIGSRACGTGKHRRRVRCESAQHKLG